jgi:hypothetical protein
VDIKNETSCVEANTASHNRSVFKRRSLHGTLVKCRFYALVLSCLLTASGTMHAQSPGYLEVGLFSSAKITENLPASWEPLTFSKIERHTDYSLVNAGDTVVVKAVSNQSASGLTRAISIDPAKYPVIQWQWKVDNILQKGDVTHKDGDDYSARIYITFALDPDRAGYLERLKHGAAKVIFGQDVPYRAISYIWGSNSPAGTMVANPYTDRVMMFVVEGGDEKVRQWVTEKRNIHKDYKQAFGEEPPMISGVAIMTDTDNTRESAIAWYGDIIFTSDQTGSN